MLFRFAGMFLLRFADRQLRGLLFQPPPRITRCEVFRFQARGAGDIALAWRRQPQVGGAVMPGPIFGIHPARAAGGIA